MLFMGWQSPPDGHWRGEIGRLVVKAHLKPGDRDVGADALRLQRGKFLVEDIAGY